MDVDEKYGGHFRKFAIRLAERCKNWLMSTLEKITYIGTSIFAQT